MKRLVLALLCACGTGGEGAPPSVGADVKPFVPASAAELGDFLPPRLGGAGRQVLPDYMKVAEGDAHAAYLAAGEGGAARTFNVNLARVAGDELDRARALVRGGKRFTVRGHAVARTLVVEARRTEARTLLADAVLVTVSVDGAADEDESVRLMAELDLDGIESLARRAAR